MSARAAVRFPHEFESTPPFRGVAGRFTLKGWCVAPHLRLTGSTLGPVKIARESRPDVMQALGDKNPASGFALEARLRPGAHLLVLEGSVDGRAWEAVREFPVVSTVAELQVSIEWPADRVVRDSVRIQGWCVHPDFPLAEIWLHYGNRQLRCEYGLPRTDVPKLFPDAPGSAQAGFIANKNIPAGVGPLRIRAVTTTGDTFLADTGVNIEVIRDEENPAPLELHGRFPDLGPARRNVSATPGVATAPVSRRILFVLYGDFTSNSALHVAQLANALIDRGHACTVTVPENADTVRFHPTARFKILTFATCLADQNFRADVIHAWTTRENVRHFCTQFQASRSCPLAIHLEDHELRILEGNTGRSLASLLALPPEELDRLVPPTLSHPHHSQAFLQAADGITVIIERLRELVPPGKPVEVIWPAADATAFFPRPIPWDFRRRLGWDEKHTVLFYHGNVHATNAAEMRELYAAVVRLNESGHPVTLLRAGRDDGDFLGELAPHASPHVIALGHVPNHQLAPLMAMADFFVQPGTADAFNDYRFPSKLPEFFALGRPVILPRTNLGELLRHGEDAWVLDRADAAGIAGAIRTLLADPGLRTRLGEGAAKFASHRFSWRRSAELLDGFYNSLLSRA